MAEVLIQDLEDFTPPERRAEARSLAPGLYQRWRQTGALVCVRINPLESVGASARVRCALLGAEDLTADLGADRTREAAELEYARSRFLLECRAAAIEPVDAPYTFSDTEGAVAEARHARRRGYPARAVKKGRWSTGCGSKCRPISMPGA